MFVVSLSSINGGVGRTTLVAQLASLLARQGQTVLALDADPQNLLAAHLGLVDASGGATPGWAGQALVFPERDWQALGQRNSDGVSFLPFGALDSARLAALESGLRSDVRFLCRQLAALDLPADTLVLIDSARLPSSFAGQALAAADLCLWVLPADPASLFCWQRDAALAGAETRRGHLLINRFDATRPLQSDVLELFRAGSGSRLLPYLIHRDEALPESFAANLCLADYAPDSQAMHDLHGVAQWLRQQAASHRPALAAAVATTAA